MSAKLRYTLQRLALAFLLVSSIDQVQLASANAGEKHPAASTDIIFLSPTEGTELNQRQFTLIAQFADVPGLDHAHYGIGSSIELASKGGFTFPDLTGAANVQLDPNLEDGTYYICSYLADVNHVHLSETICTNFTLATSGIVALSPQPESTISSYEVEIDAATFGYTSEQLAGLSTQIVLDGATPFVPQSLPLTLLLENGRHSLDFAMIKDNGSALGSKATVQFEVASALTAENLSKLARLLRRLKKANQLTKRKMILKRSRVLIEEMTKSNDHHPTCSALSSERILAIEPQLKKEKLLSSAQKATKQILFQCRQKE
jgi:hypothetical protein